MIAWLWQSFFVKNEVVALGDRFFQEEGAVWTHFREKKWHIVEKDVGRFFLILKHLQRYFY